MPSANDMLRRSLVMVWVLGGETALCVLRQPGETCVASEGYHVVIRTNSPIS